MPPPEDLRAKGDQLERLVDELWAMEATPARDLAEELLGLLSELYGAGLARVVELAGATAPALVDAFMADSLVAGLLLAYGLGPRDLADRVEAALERARPLLSSHGGDVELVEVDEQAGAVRLRLLGSCDGCPASAVTLRSAVEAAILEAAPEVVCIDVGQPVPSTRGVPVALEPKARYQACPSELVGL